MSHLQDAVFRIGDRPGLEQRNSIEDVLQLEWESFVEVGVAFWSI